MKLHPRLLVAAIAGLFSTVAQAQQAWPAKSVTLVVPFAAGGPTDVVARTLAASISKTLGRRTVTPNQGATRCADIE